MKKMLMENIKDAIYESHRHHVEAIKHRVVVRTVTFIVQLQTVV